jgi:hypothetical protein
LEYSYYFIIVLEMELGFLHPNSGDRTVAESVPRGSSTSLHRVRQPKTPLHCDATNYEEIMGIRIFRWTDGLERQRPKYVELHGQGGQFIVRRTNMP